MKARAAKPRLRLINRNLVRFRIDTEQHLALPDLLVVVHGDFNRLAGNPGVDGNLRCANERVVSRNIRLLGQVLRNTERSQGDRHGQKKHPAQPLPRLVVRDVAATTVGKSTTSSSPYLYLKPVIPADASPAKALSLPEQNPIDPSGQFPATASTLSTQETDLVIAPLWSRDPDPESR